LFPESGGIGRIIALHAFVGRNVRELLGDFDCLVEAAYSSTRPLSFPGGQSTRGPDHGIDVSLILAAAFRDFEVKSSYVLFRNSSNFARSLVAELLGFTEHAGVRATQDIFVRHANPIVETFHDRLATDNAD
jgi:hypothetical protein